VQKRINVSCLPSELPIIRLGLEQTPSSRGLIRTHDFGEMVRDEHDSGTVSAPIINSFQ
jgi:hypothetical protein